MSDDRLRRLMHETVDDLTPNDRWADIRAGLRTEENTMTTPRFAVLTAAVVGTAALIAGIAWVGGTFDDPTPVPPAGQTTDTTEPTDPAPTTSDPTAGPDSEEFTVAVYYLGDTPHGTRLYREFQRVSDETKLLAAVRTAVSGSPLDPDYWSPWPGTEVVAATSDGDVTRIELATVPTAADAADETEAAMAIEQVIRTAQAAVGGRLPVQFMAAGNPVAEVFGQPTSEPLAEGKWSAVLSLVSISDPGEGATVAGEALQVSGVASSFEATVPWRILRDGAEVQAGFFTAEGWMDKLHPFAGEIDVTGLDSGSYVLEVSTSDPSGGEGPGPFVDTRTFQIP